MPKASGEVIRFLDVYNRSSCQPKETMVPVTTAHPHLVSHLAVPSCVLLRRCAGCCSDDMLECVPTQTQKQIMEVMLVQFSESHLQQLTFEEHTQCTCRSKATALKSNMISRSCAPCRNKRKQLDLRTCRCVCRPDSGHCAARGLVFSEATCRCMKPPGRLSRRRARLTR